MAVPSSSVSAARPSLRDLALAAGVSAMTVSRVLRNHPKVTDATRRRVQKIAREFGYRPDPQVAKLMHHLRIRRKPAFQSSLCALTNLPTERMHFYPRGVIAGARQQAEARGYGFSVVRLSEVPHSPGALHRVLRSRGVEGLLLLPMAEPGEFATLLDWREFSAVATTLSVITPELHSVTPNHFRNMQQLCAELNARGYRRIGVVLREDYVRRVNHAFNAAALWHGAWQGAGFVAPLIFTGPRPRRLREWFTHEEPDAIVASTPDQARLFARELGLRIPGRIGFAAASVQGPRSNFSGIDERPAAIGASAVDLLTGLIQRGEKSTPAVPAFTQIQGRWVEGQSCPRRRDVEIRRARATLSPSPLVYWAT